MMTIRPATIGAHFHDNPEQITELATIQAAHPPAGTP
jgi:hypothetical protein